MKTTTFAPAASLSALFTAHALELEAEYMESLESATEIAATPILMAPGRMVSTDAMYLSHDKDMNGIDQVADIAPIIQAMREDRDLAKAIDAGAEPTFLGCISTNGDMGNTYNVFAIDGFVVEVTFGFGHGGNTRRFLVDTYRAESYKAATYNNRWVEWK